MTGTGKGCLLNVVLVALASDQAAIFWHPFVPVSLPLSLPASQQMRTPVMSTKAGGVAKS
jgi:hypothetical protein